MTSAQPSQSRRHWLADAPPGVPSQGTAVAWKPEVAEQYRAMGWTVVGPFVSEARHPDEAFGGCPLQERAEDCCGDRLDCASREQLKAEIERLRDAR